MKLINLINTFCRRSKRMKKHFDLYNKYKKQYEESLEEMQGRVGEEFKLYLNEHPDLKQDFEVLIWNKDLERWDSTTPHSYTPEKICIDIVLGRPDWPEWNPRDITSRFSEFVEKYKPANIQIMSYHPE